VCSHLHKASHALFDLFPPQLASSVQTVIFLSGSGKMVLVLEILVTFFLEADETTLVAPAPFAFLFGSGCTIYSFSPVGVKTIE